jgi:DNA-binding protein HU-beta
MTVGKKQLVAETAKKVEMSQRQVAKVIDTFMALIEEHLAKGEVINLPIGRIKVVERKARIGVNPNTKEKIQIPPKKAVVLKAAKRIREKLNGQK